MTVLVGHERRDQILEMLRRACPDAGLEIRDDLLVTEPSDYCADAPEGECCCLCDLIEHEREVRIVDRTGPGIIAEGGGMTLPPWKRGAEWGNSELPQIDPGYWNGAGVDVEVRIWTRGGWWERGGPKGEWRKRPDYITLMHELCGHAFPMVLGRHPWNNPFEAETPEGRVAFLAGMRYDDHWHAASIEAENACRERLGEAPRGDLHWHPLLRSVNPLRPELVPPHERGRR